MKAVINENETPVKEEYPKLVKNEHGDVFFFIRENYGVPLTGSSWGFVDKNFCDFSSSSYKFTPFTGSITLSND